MCNSWPQLRVRIGARSVGLALASAVLGNAARADDATVEPAVTPYRPTVSNPADLSVPGYLEAEFGGQRTLGMDRTRQDSIPYLVKYAFDADSGVLLGGNALVSEVDAAGRRRSGNGDAFVEWKQRFALSDNAAFGLEAGVQAPTAARGLGAGKAVYLFNGIFSVDPGPVHLDLNLSAARFDAIANGAARTQAGWAAALSWSYTPHVGAAFELSGSNQRGVENQSQALYAFNYNFSPRAVFDAGIAYGLHRETHSRTVFAGATVLLGKLH